MRSNQQSERVSSDQSPQARRSKVTRRSTVALTVAALSLGGGVTALTTSAASAAPAPSYVSSAFAPSGDGWEVTATGAVNPFGGAPSLGSLSVHLNAAIVGIASTPDGGGYWLVASDGGIFSFGDARFFGSTGALRLNRPIVGIASTPDGGGYWLVASDGGIFSFGDARFFGSTGALRLNRPIVGIASTPDGGGYWLVASDGGIFSFGDARFFGSTGAMPLKKAIVGIASTPDGGGYWLVASDGGIFSFGDAPFLGSLGATALSTAVIGIAPTDGVEGYRLLAANGTSYPFTGAATGSPTTPSALVTTPTGSVTTPTGSVTTPTGSVTTPSVSVATSAPSATSPVTAPSTPSTTTPVASSSTSLSFGDFAQPLGSNGLAAASVSSNSASYVSHLVTAYEQDYGAVGVNEMPVWTVSASQPTVTMTVAAGCNGFTSDTGTQIPIPAAATASGSVASDSPLLIDQPSTHSDWEFWQAHPTSGGNWTSCWGGKLNTATSNGVFPNPYGLSASGISYLATTITEADVASGSINHAIALVMPGCTAAVVAPADRSDCSGTSGVPYGTYYRFPSTMAMPTGLTSFGQMVFKAIQQYGLVYVDQGGAVMLYAESTSDWAAQGKTGTDPITASWGGEQEYQVVANLPWSQLEAVGS
jgi:hypothetical protein